jgi:hypothetical protein
MNEKLFADFLFRIQPWPVVSGAGRHRGNTRENQFSQALSSYFSIQNKRCLFLRLYVIFSANL